MDAAVPVYTMSCGWCGTRFYVCRPHYRGQEYCDDLCRAAAEAANHRAASARYQRSLGDDGKQDRREQERARRQRKHAEEGAVADAGSRKLASEAECCLPAIPSVSVTNALATASGRKRDGDVQTGAGPDAEVAWPRCSAPAAVRSNLFLLVATSTRGG